MRCKGRGGTTEQFGPAPAFLFQTGHGNAKNDTRTCESKVERAQRERERVRERERERKRERERHRDRETERERDR